MRARLTGMGERALSRSRWFATLWMAMAWLAGACYDLPFMLPPSGSPAQKKTDPNIPIQTSATGSVIVAISGVLQGAQVILSVNDDRVFPDLGNGDQTVIDGGNVGDAFSIEISTSAGLSCLPKAVGGQLTAAAQTVPILCHASLELVNAQPARWVIGQTDFVSTGSNNVPGSLSRPAGAGFSPATGFLYIADYGNNRVPAFTFPTQQGPNATFVIGNQVGFSSPNRVSVNGNQMVVANYGGNQVWIYDSIPTIDEQPDLALGQNSGQCLPGAFNAPSSAFLTLNNRLLVADRHNARVLLYNTVPNAPTAVASVVLGQQDSNHCFANQGNSAPSASTLSQPDDVWSDGYRIFVSDSFNHRLLFWNTWPTANGAPATWVFGQPDFQSDQPTTQANGLNQPRGIVSDGEYVYLADYGNNRILGFAFPTDTTPTNALATRVLGQANFTSGQPNAGASASPSSLYAPVGLALLNDALVVADQGNNRVLIYTSQ